MTRYNYKTFNLNFKLPFKTGYSLLEKGLIAGVFITLTIFVWITFKNMDEAGDATIVQSAQASLQAVVSQGTTRMSVSPKVLRDQYAQAVLNVIKDNTAEIDKQNEGLQFKLAGLKIVMTIQKSGRQAVYEIQDNGDVSLVGVNNFSVYEPLNGIIHKI